MKHLLIALTLVLATYSLTVAQDISSTGNITVAADSNADSIGDILLATKGITRVKIKNNGYTGYGVDDPQAILDLRQPSGYTPLGSDLYIRFRGNDPLATDWGIGLASAPNQFTAKQDTAMVMGYNVSNTGGKLVDTEPMISWRFENWYETAAGQRQMEAYIQISGIGATGQYKRPLGFSFPLLDDGSVSSFMSIDGAFAIYNSLLEPAMISWNPDSGALTFQDFGPQFGDNPVPYLAVPFNRPFVKVHTATLLETVNGSLSLMPGSGSGGEYRLQVGRNVPTATNQGSVFLELGNNGAKIGHDGQKFIFSNGTGQPNELIDDELTGKFQFTPQTVALSGQIGDWTQIGTIATNGTGYATLSKVTVISTANPYRAKTYTVRGTYADIAWTGWQEITPDNDTTSHVSGDWALDYNGSAVRLRTKESPGVGGNYSFRVLVETPAPLSYTASVSTGEGGTINGTKSRGVTVSGSNCTITAIVDGRVTAATCAP